MKLCFLLQKDGDNGSPGTSTLTLLSAQTWSYRHCKSFHPNHPLLLPPGLLAGTIEGAFGPGKGDVAFWISFYTQKGDLFAGRQ